MLLGFELGYANIHKIQNWQVILINPDEQFENQISSIYFVGAFVTPVVVLAMDEAPKQRKKRHFGEPQAGLMMQFGKHIP